mgnify:CR=1 FL=1
MSPHPSSGLSAWKLSLAYEGSAIITDLSLALPSQQITVLVGPNGCGKSTLLRGFARLLKPHSGKVYLEGQAIHRLPSREVAKRLGILPQAPLAPEGLTVKDLVAQGRYPHQSWLQQWSPEDEHITQQALLTTGMVELADRGLDRLSGGQRQRAWIAMALAQNTQTLLLDEPTTYLDLCHQVEVLDLLHDLNRTQGKTIIMVLHDLNQACRYADHLIAIHRGKIYAQGRPEQVMTPNLIKDVFGLDAQIIADPISGTPLCIPIGRYLQLRRSS